MYRTQSPKSINLKVATKLIKYSFEKVVPNTMFTLTVFERL